MPIKIVQMIRPLSFLLLILVPLISIAQREYKGLPDDLNEQKLILLNYEPINISKNDPEGEEEEYIRTRKKQHNRAVVQANEYLRTSAIEYSFKYAIAGHSS